MSPQDNINDVIGLIHESTDKYIESIQGTQDAIWNKLSYLSGQLELDADGNIKPIIANMKIMEKMRAAMKDTVSTKSYEKNVEQLNNKFPKIKGINDAYFVSLAQKFNPKNDIFQRQIKSAVKATSNSLLGAGVEANVIDPTIDILDNSISNGASWEEMVFQLETAIKGSKEKLGGLERYSKQIVTDSLNQYNANYTKMVSEKLGMEWYYYSGGIRSTSRPFCRGHYRKYYHKKEVEDFGRGKDVDGTRLTKAEKEGRVKGTNASNIFTYRGGYNCHHVYQPVLITVVPKKVIDRNIKKGYYKP